MKRLLWFVLVLFIFSVVSPVQASSWYPLESLLAYSPVEVAVAYRADGTILFEQHGTWQEVSYNAEDIKLLDSDTILSHNHTPGHCPSPSQGDYYTAWSYNIRELRVVSLANGKPQVYSLRRTGDFWPNLTGFREGCLARDQLWRSLPDVRVTVEH